MFQLDNDTICTILIVCLLIFVFNKLFKLSYTSENFAKSKKSKKMTKKKSKKSKKNIKTIDGILSLNGRTIFHNSKIKNDGDPYFLQKINNSVDANSLRLTLNDGKDEIFEIWGNSCNTSDGCNGRGERAHTFDVLGVASHNELCLQKDQGNIACINGDGLEGLIR